MSEDTEYKGPDIPVVLETAPSAMVDGVRVMFPLTHHVEEQQKASNFWQSDAIFDAATKPRHTWTSQEGAMINPDDWANSPSQANKSILYWTEGMPEPKPREAHEPPTAFLNMAAAALDSARVATNIYPDPAIQGKIDAPSGESVKQQRAGSGVANYQHTDAHYKAIKRGTRIHINLIAAYYNDDQVRESVGNDGSTSQVSLGPTKISGVTNIDLESVKYMVTVDVGPSYATQREQSQDQWMEFAGKVNDPAANQLITYWLLKQSPLQGSEDVADMYLTTMPPNIQQAIQMKDQVAGSEMDPQKLIQQIAQMKAEREQMMKHLEAANQALKNETEQLKSKSEELASRERIATEATTAKLHGQALEIQSAREIEQMRGDFQREIAEMKASLELLLQARENASDERLAREQSAQIQVIA